MPWTAATRLLCPWAFPGKNTRVGCHFLLQGIVPTQGLNPYFLRVSCTAGGFLTAERCFFLLFCIVATRSFYLFIYCHVCGFPGDAVVKNLPARAGDTGLIPGSGRSLGVGNGNPLQYSCLENSMDREAWWATVHGVEKSQIQLKQFCKQPLFNI